MAKAKALMKWGKWGWPEREPKPVHAAAHKALQLRGARAPLYNLCGRIGSVGAPDTDRQSAILGVGVQGGVGIRSELSGSPDPRLAPLFFVRQPVAVGVCGLRTRRSKQVRNHRSPGDARQLRQLRPFVATTQPQHEGQPLPGVWRSWFRLVHPSERRESRRRRSTASRSRLKTRSCVKTFL